MAALAFTVLLHGACTGLDGIPLHCRKHIKAQELTYRAKFLGELVERTRLGGQPARSYANIYLYDSGGLILYSFLPNNRWLPHNRFRGYVFLRCLRLPPDERGAWTETLDQLTSELGAKRDPIKAMITARRMHDLSGGVGVTQKLSPEAQAAARDLACLLVQTFGKKGMRAKLETSPPMARWLTQPGNCPRLMSTQPF